MMAQRRKAGNPLARLFRVLHRKFRTLQKLVFPPELIPFTPESANGHRVAAFFADVPSKIYQIAQWLPVFEKAPTHLKPVIITRHAITTEELRKITSLQVIHAPTYDLLMQLLEVSKFKALIYVNNSYQNFQTLAYQQAIHIHVNHGESDKISMVSNQAKAYDKVFVAGSAAKDRYLAAVAWIDETKLIPVGRPQLDLSTTPILDKSALKTITYAPTWEGEDEANNYTSMDHYGIKIINAAVSQSGCRVIYKPHPIGQLTQNLNKALSHDELFDKRQEVCRYYFGGIAAGESTVAFYRELEHSISEHDAAVSELSRIRRSK